MLDSLSSLYSGSTSTTSTTSTSTTTSTSSTSYSTKTVTYTPTNWSSSLQGDLYLPATSSATQARPVVLLMHGGAWQRGDKSSMSGTGKVLAQRGYAAFSINYRFAPGSTYPAQLQDMQQAVRWLQQNATTYKLDMNRLATWGYSAGGHLAALLAVQPASDLPPVRVAIAGAPPSDLAATDARNEPSVQTFMGGTYAQIAPLYEQASPRLQVHTGMAPVFLYQGTADTVVPPAQSTNFANTLKAANVPVELVWLSGYTHDTASGATSLYRDKALAFLDRYIGATTTSTGGTTTASSTTGSTTTSGTTTSGTTGTTTATSGSTSTSTSTSSTSTTQLIKDFLSR